MLNFFTERVVFFMPYRGFTDAHFTDEILHFYMSTDRGLERGRWEGERGRWEVRGKERERGRWEVRGREREVGGGRARETEVGGEREGERGREVGGLERGR